MPGKRPASIVIGRLLAWRISTPSMVLLKAGALEIAAAAAPNGGETTSTGAAITGTTAVMEVDWRSVLTLASVIGLGVVARRSSVYAWSLSAWEGATLIAVPGPPLLSLLTMRLPAVDATLPSATSSVVPSATDWKSCRRRCRSSAR